MKNRKIVKAKLGWQKMKKNEKNIVKLGIKLIKTKDTSLQCSTKK